MFIRNIWYAAAWSDEVSRTPLARTYLNEPVVLYRKRDGVVVALADVCPHRFAPLSMGHVIDDDIECGYHGLKFDCSGVCVANPHGKGIVPRAATVKIYPIVERDKLVWIWMGDPELADEATVPDYHWNIDKNYREAHGYLRVEANYLLMMDNLTDLSHAAILHPTLQGRDLCRAEYHMTEQDEEIWTSQFVPAWEIPDVVKNLTGQDGPLDQWLEMRYLPPCCMMTVFWLGQPGGTKEEAWNSFNPNIITPETDCTTHYFWGTTRNFRLDDDAVTQNFRKGAQLAFENEDRPMLEAQQRYLRSSDLMDLDPVLLSNDSGSARARRIVQQRLAQEQSAMRARRQTEPAR